MTDLTSEVMDILNAFSKDVEECLGDEVEKMSAEIVRTLKNHPNIPIRTGEYKKSFRIKKTKGVLKIKHTVYNEKYQLTHLLEDGHALPQGGRARAFPHWEDVQKLAEELPNRIAERVGN